MKRAVLLTFILVFTLNILKGQNHEPYVIYLIRHSEKVIDVNNLKDPPLTECGKLRSESLVKFFSSTDVDRIYSSDYVRTRETARPLAEARELDTEIYDANKLKEFADLLLARKEDAVVIGHSNTTPLLGRHLTGDELFGIPDSDYSRIYQIIITSEGAVLNIFHSVFSCEE